jgi:KTSC domain-containing protein
VNYCVEMVPVNSSAIRAVGYDGHTLTVEFHTGRIYDHPGVPEALFHGLVNAPSMGFYYNHFIRRRYK